uniref:DDE-1 domain-containing protein n=1 Tax=Bactrocera latifrons TaxID=174628 RepID=A0A0K8VHQ6_BACLA
MPVSLILNTKSGWMISELFANMLKHIKNFTNCSVENPILIPFDNHASHCSLESINYCAEVGIILLSFPPHTSHRLQPLDVSVFGPFKQFCRKAFIDFLTTNPGKQISIYDIGTLTQQPF